MRGRSGTGKLTVVARQNAALLAKLRGLIRAAPQRARLAAIKLPRRLIPPLP